MEKNLRHAAWETGARRLADLTPAVLQDWIRNSRLKPITLRSMLKGAACVFSRFSLGQVKCVILWSCYCHSKYSSQPPNGGHASKHTRLPPAEDEQAKVEKGSLVPHICLFVLLR